MVRERLTGDAPPASAKALVERWRGEVEARAGADLDRLNAVIHDQAAFAKVARAILRDLELIDEADAEEGHEESDDAEGARKPPLKARKTIATRAIPISPPKRATRRTAPNRPLKTPNGR